MEINEATQPQAPAGDEKSVEPKIVQPVDPTPKRPWNPRKTPPPAAVPEPAPTNVETGKPPAAEPPPEETPAPAPVEEEPSVEPAAEEGKPKLRPKEITLYMAAWSYNPKEITVVQGDLVRLNLKSNSNGYGDGIGFKVEGLPVTALVKKGETKTVEFVAESAGTFVFTCGTPCGPGHIADMMGKIIVIGGN
ncbi:MAG: cupredoxin domain-containing protein [Candidatus Diapherotrites archaeon]|uniref:Cupredoxin domain-containing protein n=1 Tax=Candidatus Iainarchaeum sp. TaxID=3101447 RepID=A0A8T4LDE7_9ARCH|nr:cupredoxin domain-containing protein [Candidatus Diapherotrites archaeon]